LIFSRSHGCLRNRADIRRLVPIYGVFLWGPTIVAFLLDIPLPKAATYFLFVSGAGFIGKIIVTLTVPLTGRRLLGVFLGFGGAATLALAGYYSAVFVGGVSLMVILLCAANFCVEGGFANLAPTPSKDTA